MTPHLRGLVWLLAGSGLRVSEGLGATQDRVDFLRGTLPVDRQLIEGGTFGPAKIASSNRVVPLGRATVASLAAHLHEFPVGESGLLFTTAGGEPWRRNKVCDLWSAARKRAGVQARGLHELGHFHASLLIAGGCSVKAVSEVLGHANAAMTLNVYAHLWADHEDKVRDAVDAVFDRPQPMRRPRKAVPHRRCVTDVSRAERGHA